MGELLTISISGVNIIPTSILGLMLIYWIITIVSGLDVSGFSIDLDMEADGIFIDALSFLKLNNVPITFYISIWVFYVWTVMLCLTFYTGINGGLLGGGILIGVSFISLIATSYSTIPFKGMFNDIGGMSLENETPLIGQVCTMKFDLGDNKTSQAQLDEHEDNVLINVQKFNNCADLKRGDKALIIEVNKEKNIYLIEPYNTNEME